MNPNSQFLLFLFIFLIRSTPAIRFLGNDYDMNVWGDVQNRFNSAVSNGRWIDDWSRPAMYSLPCVQEGSYFEAYFIGTSHYGQCFKSRDNLGMTSTWVPVNENENTADFQYWNAQSMCEIMNGGNLLIVGDSLSQQFFFSLVSSLLAQSFEGDDPETHWKLCENICDWKNKCTGPIPINCGANLKPFTVSIEWIGTISLISAHEKPSWMHVIDRNNISLLILNAGLHYYEKGTIIGNGLENRVMGLMEVLTVAYPDLSIIWRTTPVGHAYCVRLFQNAPSTMLTNENVLRDASPVMGSSRMMGVSEVDEVGQNKIDAYGWELISNQSKVIHEMLRSSYPSVFVLDLTHPMQYRADSHSYDRPQGMDCLHYCLPGPVDSWVEFLFNALRMIKSSPSLDSTGVRATQDESSDSRGGGGGGGAGMRIDPDATAKAWTQLHYKAFESGIILRPIHYSDVFFLMENSTRRYIQNERFLKMLQRIVASQHDKPFSIPNPDDPLNKDANIPVLDKIDFDLNFYKIPKGKPYTEQDWRGVVTHYLSTVANFSKLSTCPHLEAATMNRKELPRLLSVSNIPLLAADLYYGHLTPYQLAPYLISTLQSRSLHNLLGTGSETPSATPIDKELDIELDANALHCLKPGTVIYVSTDWLPTFFQKIYPRIPVPFVLVSGGTDDSTPYSQKLEGYVAKYVSTTSSTTSDADYSFTQTSKILHWYAQNCDGNPNPNTFSCLPLGLSDVTFWSGSPSAFDIIEQDFGGGIRGRMKPRRLSHDYGESDSSGSSGNSGANGVNRRRLRRGAEVQIGSKISSNSTRINSSDMSKNRVNYSSRYGHSKKQRKENVSARRLQAEETLAKASEYDVLVPNYKVGTHPDRNLVMGMFCDSSLAISPISNYLHFSQTPASPSSSSGGNINTTESRFISKCLPPINPLEMFRHTQRSAFVISPHGHGLDCHETWETLYLGSYPIVKSSSLDELYRGLPVLILREWSDLNKELLQEARLNFSLLAFSYESLEPAYWANRIHSHQLFHHHSHNHDHSSTSSNAGNSFGLTNTLASGHYREEKELEEEEEERIFMGYNYSRFAAENNLPEYHSSATLNELHLRENSVVKIDNALFYAILNGTRNRIPSVAQFYKYGWEFSDAKLISEVDFNKILEGPDVS